LDVLATFAREHIELVHVFHALGKGLHAKGVGEGGDRADDGMAIATGAKVIDKTLVDLDLVEGKRPKLAERRIACSEIVERNLHAKIAKTVKRRQRLIDVGDEDAFGNLEFKPLGRQAAG
jgi:hypothetical protein